MLIDIELCHVYLRQFAEDGGLSEDCLASIERGRNYAQAMAGRGHGVRYSVMLDDTDGTVPDDVVAKIRELISAQGIEPDLVIHESQLEAFAPLLIEAVRPVYRLTQGLSDFLSVAAADRYMWGIEDKARVRSARDIFFEQLKGRGVDDPRRYQQYSKFWVPLRTQGTEPGAPVIYSCPLLTGVWYLTRLGVGGFDLVPSRGHADLVVNVLPIEYLKNEAMAFEIIRLSSAARIRKGARKIEYIFI